MLTIHELVLTVRVTADLWYWLTTEASDPRLLGCDPYGDATLDAQQLNLWRDAIDHVAVQLKQRIRADLELGRRIPRDPTVRKQCLDTMVANTLARDPRAKALTELTEAIDLALENGVVIEAVGD